jgi:hypothetical protein
MFMHLDERLADSKARADTLRAEQEARQASAAEAKRIEEDRRQQQVDLIDEANAWQQSKTILAYVELLTARAAVSGNLINADMKAWIECATSTAENMDPMNKRLS